ncbi:MAG: hypothetical protein GF331_02120 [Chitinivibrionales bacterium]|nr:hypothetical protein [Chitinivibrionales bacterium]
MSYRTHMKLAFLLVCIVLLSSTLRCSMSPIDGGGGHDGDAGAPLIGLVVDKEGQGVADVHVLLLPDDFNPIHDSMPACGDDGARTDSASDRHAYCAISGGGGEFLFATVTPGYYTLNGADTLGRRIYVPRVSLSGGTDTVDLGAHTFYEAGVALVARPDTTAVSYAFIPGTDIGARFDSLEPYVRLPVPTGSVDLYVGYQTADTVDTVVAVFTARQVLEGEVIDSSGVLDTLQTPVAPLGPDSAVQGSTVCYIVRPVVTRKGLGADYRFRMGDGAVTQWLRDTTVCHRWDSTGAFGVVVQARSAVDTLVISSWSDTLDVHVVPPAPVSDTVAPPLLIGPGDTVAVDSAVSVQIAPGATSCSGSLQHRVDFGDGTMSLWSFATTVSHVWYETGIDTLRAQSRCSVDTNAVSEWSPIVVIEVH